MSGSEADPALRSASELVAGLNTGAFSSRELLAIYVERVNKYNGELNAVVALDVERATEVAQAIDDARSRGADVGPLGGLPVTIKDAFETAGLVTTSGAPELRSYIPAQDADSVALLRRAGAVIFGKTNLPLYAGDLQSYNEIYGTTNNPWNHSLIPGGSSGGAAAAIAAGLSGLELGSDIGGSIRNPAHFCGVYGHKPSYGVVPMRGHIPGAPGQLSDHDVGVAGPIARSAGDLALAMDVLAAPSPADAAAWSLTLPPARHVRIEDWRVAVWLDEPSAPIDQAVGDALDGLLATLTGAGVAVTEAARPDVSFETLTDLWEKTVLSAIAAGMPAHIHSMADSFVAANPEPTAGDNALERFMRVAAMRHRDWLAAHEERSRARAAFASFFTDYDVIIAPAISVAAFPHAQTGTLMDRTIEINGAARPYSELPFWSGAFGCVYLPATVAPIGLTADGRPVGVQIVGPYLEDRTTIEFARLLEPLVGGYEAPPGY